MPHNRLQHWNGGLDTLIQWPLFLLANKVYSFLLNFMLLLVCRFCARIDTVVSQGFKSFLNYIPHGYTRRIDQTLYFDAGSYCG